MITSIFIIIFLIVSRQNKKHIQSIPAPPEAVKLTEKEIKQRIRKEQTKQLYYDLCNSRRRQLQIISELEKRAGGYNISNKEYISLKKQIAAEYNKLYKINQKQIELKYNMLTI